MGAALLFLGVAACGHHPQNQICAGQCGPPYKMMVTFTRGTSLAEADSDLRSCQNNPVVIRIREPKKQGGVFGATLFTTQLGAITPPATRLVHCLERERSVLGAGWPD